MLKYLLNSNELNKNKQVHTNFSKYELNQGIHFHTDNNAIKWASYNNDLFMIVFTWYFITVWFSLCFPTKQVIFWNNLFQKIKFKVIIYISIAHMLRAQTQIYK